VRESSQKAKKERRIESTRVRLEKYSTSISKLAKQKPVKIRNPDPELTH